MGTVCGLNPPYYLVVILLGLGPDVLLEAKGIALRHLTFPSPFMSHPLVPRLSLTRLSCILTRAQQKPGAVGGVSDVGAEKWVQTTGSLNLNKMQGQNWSWKGQM